MDELSLEYRIERQRRGTDTLIKAGVIAAALLFVFLAVFMNALFLLPALGCLVAGIIFFPRLDVEYEYLFVAGELSVDCIYSKKSRRNLVNYSLSDVEFLLPENEAGQSGQSGQSGQGKASYRKLDLSSGREEADRYVLACPYMGNMDYALIEPGEKIIKAIYDRYPKLRIRRNAN